MRLLGIGLVAVGLCLFMAGVVQSDDQADAKPILDKAAKAMGGEDKLAKMKIGTAKGKLTVQEGGQMITALMDTSWSGLDKYRADVEVQVNGMSNKVLLVVNGDNTWGKSMDRTEELPKEVQPFIRDLLYALRAPQLIPSLRGNEFKLSPLGELKIDDKPAVGLLVNHKDHKDMSLFFDKDTGLPLKTEIRLKEPQGQEVTIEFHYADYKDFDGVKHPAKIAIKVDNKEMAVELSEIKAEEKLDESAFAKP